LEPGASWPDLSTAALEELRRAGIRWLEVRLWEVTKLPPEHRVSECQRVVTDAARLGLGIWSAHIPFGGTWDVSAADQAQRARMMEDIKGAIELCRVLRPRVAVIHASAEPIQDVERQQRLRTSRETLQALAPRFAQMDVKLALEVLPRTCLGNCSDEVLWLIEGLEATGVCLDTNHLLKESHAEFVRKVGKRIVTLHVSDYDGVDEKHWMPGEGIIRWRELVADLAAVGYAGPFMYEAKTHRDGSDVKPNELVAFLKGLTSA
jgi:sugar phosphate isomerase/epimerase